MVKLLDAGLGEMRTSAHSFECTFSFTSCICIVFVLSAVRKD